MKLFLKNFKNTSILKVILRPELHGPVSFHVFFSDWVVPIVYFFGKNLEIRFQKRIWEYIFDLIGRYI